MSEADYLIRRAGAQLELAGRATMRTVIDVHLELSSRYLAKAREVIDGERLVDRRANVISIAR